MGSWRLSARADADLLEIYLYGLGNFGRSQAVDYLDGLAACFDLIANHPDMGRVAETLGVGVRRFEHRRHVTLYERTENGVLILAVVHERSVRGLSP